MFASVHLPAFALQAVLRWREELWPTPVAVVDPESGLLLERTLPAAAQGVDRGLTAPQSLARCPSLQVLTRSARQEKTLTAVLLEIALRHSPFVEDTASGLATLDLRGLHPKISWHEVGDRIVQDLATAGIRATAALAKNAAIARLAAREADPVCVVRDAPEFLRPLPLTFLDPPSELLEILHSWGLRTIGEFLALPSQQTLDRLGPAAREIWATATGRSRRPLALITPAESFEESCDLGYAVETTEPLLFLLRRFIDQLADRLRARWLVASQMTLTLPLDDRSTHERTFSIPEPTARPDVLFRIVSTHLESLTLPEKPVGLHLRITPAPPTRQQFGLFGAALRDPNRFGETLARLGALVGSENVGFPEPEDTHRPDRVRLLARVEWTLEESPSPDRPLLGLPLRRCRPPVAASVRLHGRTPAHISSPLANGRITESLGPYRLSGNWWDPQAWHTEEWDIAVSDHLYRLTRSPQGWLIEGTYD
ncbi:MAG: DNA polymerase Y family protein [Terrimicrobiaceae bacterium]|nr:DNA polymerase Y family protein [Terrimicrobiaceae bacterium]